MASIVADRPEPIGITIADLVALVVGVAVAVALPWQFWPRFLWPGAAWTLQREGRVLVQFLTVALSRACLALVPVVLARRVRYGGIARPAEFLAALCSLPMVVPVADHFLFMLRFGFDPWTGLLELYTEEVTRRSEQWELWQDQSWWLWTIGLFVLACASILALALGRRVLPVWLQTILLLFTCFGLARASWAGAASLFSAEKAANATASVRMLYHVGFSIAGMLPYKLFYDIPACAAWHRLLSRSAPRPSWLEQVALGLVGALFVATCVQHLLPVFRSVLPVDFWVEQIRFFSTTAVAIILGLTVARRLLPAWSGLDAAADSGETTGSHP